MRRVVVTGLGIVSSIGNNASEVLAALKAGKSGIVASEEMTEHGFRSRIAGTLKIDVSEMVDKRTLRFMGPGAAYAHIAMAEAIADAGLTEDDIVNPRTGLVAGSGGPSTSALFQAHQTVLSTGATKRIGPFAVPKCMSSTISANLATAYKIKGINYSITSACSTSLHCIGNAAEQIMMGKQDVMFAGGGEELDWTLSCLFDAMGAMSSKFNDTPEKASRAFDANRDGFVISGGGGMVVLEDLEHALARGAEIYAEVTGFAATSDGHDMVAPSGEGGERAMRLALQTLPEGRKVGYINAHGTSTPVGDVGEIEAVRRVFGQGTTPPVSSTKSMTGHAQGAAGALEAIFCLLMLKHDFITPSINVETLDERLDPAEIATKLVENAGLDSVMTNSFGFGGTNGSMILSKYKE
ncbi:beta-ketoacyl-ACP synthase I [Sulfitobacter pseudonitzschiae]|uniref:3-oxoacyl-[acyl-carrier-protein] synthase 1 n=1 Tax=Pseudosulfitobacter pseudonitzschiae TaxID=1402135 RepID=A0A9Q2NPX3_9RHOB|nr:beta-ketoacyl-ACP synthase I [Pseudosulfitobacter pseudonitzschiae]MBM2292062.1 beta-ketoacyl-ACP synthase I [Pseudosulfitobacter pseudonitzschiae]MBM2296980.1 beta-ketoacyl-ACP synthase I [Pseudosulfitobacter pseudonitzschiae]MBM2301894.1 beta-ketoacyl-ACP synthase I [Pseudosulfitobacter pseudonitzschiae]MBM2311676.1 beta-ketoacyl-ACP synthase I [Pseudosulfitobacter pseudonitzschiae]MBM2316590.1 beta-ketoacyl-ACP synthase I [Pseudosulfitobacter pseudonitzschiae]|tara:strand:+ start:192831 stop:194060 length:1230 start_codon:yes stop_codon:yes gene_type:complete